MKSTQHVLLSTAVWSDLWSDSSVWSCWQGAHRCSLTNEEWVLSLVGRPLEWSKQQCVSGRWLERIHAVLDSIILAECQSQRRGHVSRDYPYQYCLGAWQAGQGTYQVDLPVGLPVGSTSSHHFYQVYQVVGSSTLKAKAAATARAGRVATTWVALVLLYPMKKDYAIFSISWDHLIGLLFTSSSSCSC